MAEKEPDVEKIPSDEVRVETLTEALIETLVDPYPKIIVCLLTDNKDDTSPVIFLKNTEKYEIIPVDMSTNPNLQKILALVPSEKSDAYVMVLHSKWKQSPMVGGYGSEGIINDVLLDKTFDIFFMGTKPTTDPFCPTQIPEAFFATLYSPNGRKKILDSLPFDSNSHTMDYVGLVEDLYIIVPSRLLFYTDWTLINYTYKKLSTTNNNVYEKTTNSYPPCKLVSEEKRIRNLESQWNDLPELKLSKSEYSKKSDMGIESDGLDPMPSPKLTIESFGSKTVKTSVTESVMNSIAELLRKAIIFLFVGIFVCVFINKFGMDNVVLKLAQVIRFLVIFMFILKIVPALYRCFKS